MGPGQRPLRTVLDTSALVSALLFGGEPGRLVPLWETGRIIPLISKDVFLEYARVLGYPKFALSAEDVRGLLEEHVLPHAEMVAVVKTPRIVPEDPGDDKFLALAATGQADVLVSGDKHLLALGRYGSVDILSPRQLLERLERPADEVK